MTVIALLFAGLLFVCLALPVLRTLDTSYVLPGWLSGFIRWSRPVQVVYLATAAVIFLGLLAYNPGAVGFLGLAVAIGLVLWFLRCWVQAFLFLMGLSDDDLPGRFDKVIWAVVLVVTGPLGLWTFHCYRAERWPVPGSDERVSAPGKPVTSANEWF